ncbi:hypothetical protein GCM10027299_11210 [Larkinella ripae]
MNKINACQPLGGLWLFLAINLSACSDHLEPSSSPVEHIRQSEQLSIPATVDLPANAPQGNTRVATYFAEGVQKYKAQAKAGSDPLTYEWVFVAPEARLYDATNAQVGTHFAGPTWQLANQDQVIGQAYSPAKTASLDPKSIDWLLLMPKPGTVASGIFQQVEFIQRIATTGGKAPATLPATATETVEVPYTAVYRFSKRTL